MKSLGRSRDEGAAEHALVQVLRDKEQVRVALHLLELQIGVVAPRVEGVAHGALDELSEKHKRVIELRMFQGKSFAEIAPELGYDKEVTVRSLHMRAMQRLQELLAAFGR